MCKLVIDRNMIRFPIIINESDKSFSVIEKVAVISDTLTDQPLSTRCLMFMAPTELDFTFEINDSNIFEGPLM